MQRLHPLDLSGYLMREEEQDDWEVISLPCLYVGEGGQLQALWPFKHTVEELQAMQAANELVFDRQYLQVAETKKGKLFPDLHFYNPETVDIDQLVEFRVGVIDPADEGGDDLSFPLGYLVGNKIYIPDVIYNNDGTDINEPACVEQICSKKLNYVAIEGNSAWKIFAKNVRSKVQDPAANGGRGYEDCEIRVVKNTINKHSRIWAHSSWIKNNCIFRSDYRQHPQYYKFMKNLLDYNKTQEGNSKNKHDDAPDSLALLAAYFKQNFGQLW
jgi:predicted phage terminase large subunit-like protein